ncbi:MAG TPA: fructose-6-phosphate aldolase [Polyangia bacterium]|jgi:transaldolase|nr:fructose-6-phosphate aldolase [Polyangia bacterium]
MKFFIDTGDVGEVREAQAMGLLDGITTNPSLIAKSGRKYRDVVIEMCEIVNGPISAEVLSTTYDEMMTEAREWHKVHKNIVVKLPLIPEGLKALRTCRSEGINVNVTLCFSANQALLAAKAGANYISPFIGRIDDISETGMELIEKIVTIYNNYNFETEVLVASVRNPTHVVDAAMLGADICTIPFTVLMQLSKHPLTDVGLKKFVEDAKKIPR